MIHVIITILLKTINAPADGLSGTFLATVKLVPDFAGDVWADVSYPDGTKKETEPILNDSSLEINERTACKLGLIDMPLSL